MRRALLWGLAVLLTGCFSMMQPTPKSLQRDALASHAPAQIEAESEKDPDSASRVIRVLVLLDQDFTEKSLHVEEDVQRQFRRASAYAASAFDARFLVVSIDRWPHRLGTDPLEKAVADLAQFQPGKDVDWVVGFVAPMQVVETNHDTLGMAHLLGKHAVLRGYSDAAEMGEVRREFRALDDIEIVEFFRKHKEHKQTSLLLHEWAHTLGAPHDVAGKGFMHPSYSRMQNGFSPASKAILEAMLPLRLEGATAAKQVERLNAVIAALPPGSAAPEDIEHIHTAAARVAAQPAPQPQQRTGFTEDERKRYEQAVQVYKAGMYSEVEKQLVPLIKAHPDEGVFRTLECQAAVAAAPGDASAFDKCKAGAAAAKDAPGPLMVLASAQLSAKKASAAAESLAAGVERLKSASGEVPGQWAHVAQVARQLSCVSIAEDAVKRAGEDPSLEPVRAWIVRTRRWTSLPGPLPTCEREHVEGFRAALELMERSPGQAQSRVAAFAPGPARESLSCELALRKNQLKPARQACEKALAAFADSTHARYLLGVIAGQEGKHAEVVEHLERLIVLDPENHDAWSRLAASHRKLGQSDKAQSLEARFQQKFHRPLR
jgi:tetratricopeptide (TPR) repeat protein